MCGRTACTLQKDSVIKACTYTAANGSKVTPNWKDVHTNDTYKPSYNMTPGRFTPVLIKSNHLEKSEETERTICPMRWGLIPPWYKGEKNKFEFKTINCQSETIQEKPSYRTPLLKGKRCVIIADGFFEWKKLPNGKKQPHFIYLPQSDGFNMQSRKWTSEEQTQWCEQEEWRGPRLLTMAGLFDVWKSADGELLYSYTVITVKSSSSLSWLHDRMPAILNNDDDIKKWLDYDAISVKEALMLLHPVETLEWYPVSTAVNNSANQTTECVLPINTKKPNIPSESNFLTSWLKKTPAKKVKDEVEPSEKHIKLS